MINNTKKIITLITAACVAFVGIIYFIYSLLFDNDKMLTNHFGASVEVALVEKKMVNRHIVREGKLQPENSVEIKSQIQGIITKIIAKGGDKVNKGDVLIEVDPKLYKAQLDEARAKLVIAEHEYKIAEQLAKQNNASQVEAAKKKAAFNIAEANVEKAEYQLENTKIKAPFEGYVSLRNSNKISIGALVDRNTVILTLNDNDPMIIDFRIPEKDATKPYIDQEIDIRVDSFLHKSFKAKIMEISPRIDAASGLSIRAHLDNSDGVLKPGMSCKVNIIIESDENALTVPEEAIQTVGNEHFVFRIRQAGDKKFAEKVLVKIGILSYGYRVVKTKKLQKNDRVIVNGNIKISNNYPVRETNLDELGIVEKVKEKTLKQNNNSKKIVKSK